MFGKKKEKKQNKNPDSKPPKKQKNGFDDTDGEEFEDLMEDLDNYN